VSILKLDMFLHQQISLYLHDSNKINTCISLLILCITHNHSELMLYDHSQLMLFDQLQFKINIKFPTNYYHPGQAKYVSCNTGAFAF